MRRGDAMYHMRKSVTLQLLCDEVRNAIRVSDRPVFVGDAGIDYLCGNCGFPLCTGMREGDLGGLAFVCACGWSNRVPCEGERPVDLGTPIPAA